MSYISEHYDRFTQLEIQCPDNKFGCLTNRPNDNTSLKFVGYELNYIISSYLAFINSKKREETSYNKPRRGFWDMEWEHCTQVEWEQGNLTGSLCPGKDVQTSPLSPWI